MLSAASRRLSIHHRHYTKLPKPIHKLLSNVPSRYRRRAIQFAQQALTDYLHNTRAVQFTYAECISKNSIFALSNAIAKIDFKIENFADRFSRWLTYHPIDEVNFFYESIGIEYKEVPCLTTSWKCEVIIGNDFRAFSVACVLCGFGFPWRRLGEMFRTEAGVFELEGKVLGYRFAELKKIGGFKNAAVVGMCLAFPQLLLRNEGEFGVVVDVLILGNERLAGNEEEGSLEFWYEMTRIVKMMYDVGMESGNVGDLVDMCKRVFKDYPVQGFVEKVQYFCKLGVEKRDVVMLLLERPKMVGLDMEGREFLVSGFLKHFGMSEEEVEMVGQDFPYVLGRSKMENMPCAMRVMDLHNWFFDQLRNGGDILLTSYVMKNRDIETDKLYKDGFEKILPSSSAVKIMSTLSFLRAIGFGENESTLNLLYILSKYNTLQESFDCFVAFGADYSRLCRSIACWPSILRQDPYTLTEKLDFLVSEVGLSLSYFYNHPECLDFDLDKRLKPRLKFYDWIAERGLDTRSFSLCKKIKQRDKAFVASVSSLHSAAPKHYFENFVHSPKFHSPPNHNSADLPKLECNILSYVPIQCHDKMIEEAQKALKDYLQTTRSIPVTYAEKISKNSVCSLSNVISNINFSLSSFTKSFIDYLNCHSIDEVDFFCESIGINIKDIPSLLPASKILNIQEFNAFNVACTLYELGFPWNQLGDLYTAAIFSMNPKQLTERFFYIKTQGFKNVAVVGMCLTFPELFQESERGVIDLLLNDIRRVYELTNDVHQVVDSSYDVFRKMKLLYDIGLATGELFYLADKSRSFFVDYSEDVVIEMIKYFSKLGVGRKDIALFLLKCPEVLGFDLITPKFSVLDFLKHFEMSEIELESVKAKFPHVMGGNKMANMPCVMRALDLQNWVFDQINNGSHQLLANYATKNSGEDADKYYKERLYQIRVSKSCVRLLSKLKFLHAIGFGENKLTMQLLHRLSGNCARLQERFDCYIDLGANYSNVCGMILRVPMMLNSDPDAIKEKINYLFQEMGLTMTDLYKLPLYLESDLYKQINPRYMYYEWLIDKGLSIKPFSLVTLMTTKGTRFIGMSFCIHPAAPKHYLERFLYREI